MRSLFAAIVGLSLVVSGCRHVSSGTPDARTQALELVAEKRFEQALPLLEKQHRADPTDLEIARELTRAHVRTHRAELFITRLEEAEELPNRPPAVTRYMLGLARFAGPAQAEASIADFEAAVAQSPDEPEFHYRLGLVLLESERYDRAVAPLRRAAELAPSRNELLLPLAKALARTGDRPGAVAALGRFVRGEPSPADVQTARALMDGISDPFVRFPQAARTRLEEGLVWLQERDIPQQAILAFEGILREYPDLGVVHALLGLCYQRIDDAGRAVEEFKRAIELSPDDGRHHLYLAQLYQSRQRPEQAQPYFERALQLDPLLDEAWLHLGDHYLERADLEKAKEAFRVLAALQPGSIPALGKYALVLQLQKDYPAADEVLRRVIARDPENLEFTLRLGMLHLDRWKNARSAEEKEVAARESESWLRKVLQAQPQNAVASRALETLKAR